MGVYLETAVLASFAAVLLHGSGSSMRQRNRLFVVIAFGMLAFLSAMRAVEVGADTFAYEYSFYESQYLGLEHFFTSFSIKNETGFYLLEHLVACFTGSFRVWLIFIAVVVMYGFGRFVYEHSNSPYLSFLCFFSLFFPFFGTTGLRQALAQAVCLLYSYRFIDQRKLIPFALSVLAAAMFHKSALLLLPFYFISNIKVDAKIFLVFLISMVIIWFARATIVVRFSALLGYNGRYENQITGAGTATFSLFLLAVVVFAYFYLIRNRRLVDEDTSKHLLACMCAALFLPFTFIDPNLLRAMYYYSVYLILLVADIPCAFDEVSRKLCSAIFTVLFLYMIAQGSGQYMFFWS